MGKEWRLIGYDTYDHEYYPLLGSYADEKKARQAGVLRIKELNETQSPEESGGQDDEGIQDRVFIQRPDGSIFRFIPLAEEFVEKSE